MVSTTKRYGIIVGIDGSPESDAAVSWAAHDAAIRGLPLTVVHVESPAAATWSQAPVLEESPEEQQAEGRSLLAHASTIARDAIADTAQIHINGELLSSTTPVPTLVEQSKDAELIVVGSRGRGALSRSFSAQSALDSFATHTVPSRLFAMWIRSCRIPHRLPYSWESTAQPQTSRRQSRSRKRPFGTPSLIALHAWNDIDMNAIPGYDWSPTTAKEGHLLAEALAGWQERYPDVSVQTLVV